MPNFVGSEISYFIVGHGSRWTGAPVETFPVSITGISATPVSDRKDATWFGEGEELKAKNVASILTQFSTLMGNTTTFSVRKQTITTEELEG